MDNLRIFLWVGLLMLVWLTVQTWQETYGPGASTATESASTDAAAPPAAERSSTPGDVPDLPSVPNTGQSSATAAGIEAGVADGAPAAAAPAVVTVRTDVMDAEIDLQGGTLRSVRLPTYPVHKDQPDVPVQLLNPDPKKFFAIQSGLRATDGQPEANHQAPFKAEREVYTLAEGADELVVPLTWTGARGITVTKTYRFRRGHFAIELNQLIANDSAAPYGFAPYLQLQREFNPPERSMFDVDTYSFFGPVLYDGQKYTRIDVEDLATEPLTASYSQGWIASLQHHFIGAVVPPAGASWDYEARFSGGRYLVRAVGPLTVVPPGSTTAIESRLFVGPKLQNQMEETAQGLELTVDYGRLAVLAQPLFWLLEKIHTFVGNWGLAIIICTLLIKLVFYKLSETSGRSMARMRKLQPRMKALQERFKDDRQAMSSALMDLYKKEKVNPAAGCLPMLVQIPFFIAFYWVLLESVEMRQAPFALWITDLSSRDPFFVLPLLMGAAMFFQQKLNPPPPDPVQAKMMQIMPIIFTGFFAFFPAGLVLYWLTNSVLSIAQQWRINKVLGAD